MTQTMRRWELGGLGREHLRLAEVPAPELRAGEILVQVRAVALNFRDGNMIRTGLGQSPVFPITLASDAAGTVARVGEGVTRFKEGDRVISLFFPEWIDGPALGTSRVPNYRSLGGGSYPGVLQDYVALHEDWLTAAPASLDDAEASTLPCAGLTAWMALVERGRVHAGQSVLVEGTGGVALFAAAIGRAHGAEVFVVSGHDDKLERARALGLADRTINRETGDWVEAVHRLTGDRGIDHVLEIVGGAHLAKALQAVAVGGSISMIGVLAGGEISGPVGPLLLKTTVIQGIAVGHRRAQEDLVRAIDHLGIRPVIDGRYAFEELPAALDHLDRGAFGKIVVEL